MATSVTIQQQHGPSGRHTRHVTSHVIMVSKKEIEHVWVHLVLAR